MTPYIIIAVLVTCLVVQTLYTMWRIHNLDDDVHEARELAERLADKLNKRPVRVRTIIYANGEKVNESLSV